MDAACGATSTIGKFDGSEVGEGDDPVSLTDTGFAVSTDNLAFIDQVKTFEAVTSLDKFPSITDILST